MWCKHGWECGRPETVEQCQQQIDMLAVLPHLLQFVDEEHPPVYRPINWGEFRSKRYEGAGPAPCC